MIIYKYPVERKMFIPEGAKLLHCGYDGEQRLCLWYLIDASKELEEKRIEIIGTGSGLVDDFEGEHLGTVVMQNGLVWHIFELEVGRY